MEQTSFAIFWHSYDLHVVYVNPLSDAYNSRMWTALRIACLTILLAVSASAQETSTEQLSIVTKELPPASMWNSYDAQYRHEASLRSEGGVPPYHWSIVAGSLPNGLKLEESGTLRGIPQESGEFEFTVLVRDSSNPPLQAKRPFILKVETPFSAEWDRKAHVNGQRIDGSVKVSNRTGRDFDLTFIVLAVNDIGRATAIGYQHFPLKSNTRDFSIPFGDTLSPGNYIVNVDAVAEEPVSRNIFRARLVTGKESITQGP